MPSSQLLLAFTLCPLPYKHHFNTHPEDSPTHTMYMSIPYKLLFLNVSYPQYSYSQHPLHVHSFDFCSNRLNASINIQAISFCLFPSSSTFQIYIFLYIINTFLLCSILFCITVLSFTSGKNNTLVLNKIITLSYCCSTL